MRLAFFKSGMLLICLGLATILLVVPSVAAAQGKIAFSSNRDGDYDIYVMNPDGTGLKQLTTSEGFDGHPAFSPDGRYIAFASDRHSPFFYEIYVMNADGSGQRRLTYLNWQATNPSFSLDGTKIAFDFHDGVSAHRIFVMNSDGSGVPTPLTDDPTSEDTDPAFGGNGFIVYVCDREQICIMNGNGSNKTKLFLDPIALFPSVSPDGGRIVFTHDSDIYTMKIDGSEVTQLTAPPNLRRDRFPTFSPNGVQIAFDREQGAAGPRDIYVMDANGQNLVNITNNAADDGGASWTLYYDSDGDGFDDSDDNCPEMSNADQADFDGDGIGDACDADDDNDGVNDADDEFPLDPNESSDNDGDGVGDNGDTDDDNDGVTDPTDNCALQPNSDQADFDLDGIGDTCDAQTGPPTNKNQCKNGGWARFDHPRAFVNQGDCLQFVLGGG